MVWIYQNVVGYPPCFGPFRGSEYSTYVLKILYRTLTLP